MNNVDIYTDWETYRKRRVKGYTFRYATDVYTLYFASTGEVSPGQIRTMTKLLEEGWVITAIYFEDGN